MSIQPNDEVVEKYYESLSPYWHPVARVYDVEPRKIIRTEILGKEIIVVRLDGKIAVLDDLCRHFQAKLSDGVIEANCPKYSGEVVRCRYHGWAYKNDGECVDIPQLPEGKRIPKAARVKSYHVRIEHDLVWVCLTDKPEFDIPKFPETASNDMVNTAAQYSSPWKCSIVRMILSALDDYHFPWLHEGVLGSRDNVTHPKRDISRNGMELKSTFSTTQPRNVTNSEALGASENNESIVFYEMIVSMPNVIRLIKRSGDGNIYVVMFYPTPKTYNETGIFWSVSRNYATSRADEESIVNFESFVQSQDKVLVSNQRPWLQNAMPVAGADDALIEYLKWIKELNIPNQI